MKPKHLIPIAFLFLLIALPVGLAKQDDPVTVSNYRLSGPYTHKNLTVFLIHGKDQTNKTFLTLQEALAQKKVKVYETKEVNELAIQNLSNQDIYVQAGDIVRGGDQDRMISIDFIVPPRSGRMPIAAFCVESGRWNKRGNEGNASFASSENSATNDIETGSGKRKISKSRLGQCHQGSSRPEPRTSAVALIQPSRLRAWSCPWKIRR